MASEPTSRRRAASTRRFAAAAALAAAIAMRPSPAWAHDGSSASGIAAGLSHPFGGLDHLLAMVAVGALAMLLRRRTLAVPLAFVGALVAGAFLGLGGVALPGHEAAIALSLVALGAAVMASSALHLPLAIGLVALAGIFHGNAHGLEAPRSGSTALYIAGFVSASAVLHGLGAAAGRVLIERVNARRAIAAGVITAGLGLALGVI